MQREVPKSQFISRAVQTRLCVAAPWACSCAGVDLKGTNNSSAGPAGGVQQNPLHTPAQGDPGGKETHSSAAGAAVQGHGLHSGMTGLSLLWECWSGAWWCSGQAGDAAPSTAESWSWLCHLHQDVENILQQALSSSLKNLLLRASNDVFIICQCNLNYTHEVILGSFKQFCFHFRGKKK